MTACSALGGRPTLSLVRSGLWILVDDGTALAELKLEVDV